MVSLSARVVAGVMACALFALLVVGASLRPKPVGHGTHEELGLPACGFVIATGHPCPTCGMTTAVTLAAHGHPLQAFLTQPFGAIFALGAAVGFWGCAHVAVCGSRLGRLAEPLLQPRVLWIVAGLCVAAWLYKLAAWKT